MTGSTHQGSGMSAKTRKSLLLLGQTGLFLVSLLLPAPVLAQTSFQTPMTSTPNYWGDPRMGGYNGGYGTYSQPYTGYSVQGSGTPQTSRQLPGGFGGTFRSTSSHANGSNFNASGMFLGGTIAGASLLSGAATRMTSMGRGLGSGMGSGRPSERSQEAADERRRKQEEKIHAELAKAHEENLKRQGIPVREQPAKPTFNQDETQVSQRGLASEKFKDEAEGDLIPGDTAKALSF